MVSDEVASMEEVKEMKPHLAKHHPNFPRRRATWKTLILLGRDCPWAMPQEIVNVPEEDNGLIVSKTPLGWTLIGPKSEMKRNPNQNLPENKGQAVSYTDSEHERASEFPEAHVVWRVRCENRGALPISVLDYECPPLSWLSFHKYRACPCCQWPVGQPGSRRSQLGRQRSDRKRTLVSVTGYGCG